MSAAGCCTERKGDERAALLKNVVAHARQRSAVQQGMRETSARALKERPPRRRQRLLDII
eukprot:1172097-Pleurochrysis_carterae.AAC.3